MLVKVHKKNGFTLIELILTIIIIGVISGTVFINYNYFSSRTLLRNTAFEITEYIRTSQVNSISSYIDGELDVENIYYQSIRIVVRDGFLKHFQIEDVSYDQGSSGKEFTKYSETFPQQEFSKIKSINKLSFADSDQYKIYYCFLVTDDDGSGNLVLEEDSVQGTVNRIIDTIPLKVCEIGDSAEKKWSNVELNEKNNYDIHISLEFPSQETYSAILPIDVNDDYQKDQIVPLDEKRDIEGYIGLRVFIIDSNDIEVYRYFDVIENGLIYFGN